MEQQDYNNTLNLPKTEFPMRAGLPQREPEALNEWQEKHLYEKVIYDAYIENGCWVLTAEQREEAYRIYKECKEEKDEN